MNKIIQCPACSTKFAINENQLAGLNSPKFHCSRCDAVFSLDQDSLSNSKETGEQHVAADDNKPNDKTDKNPSDPSSLQQENKIDLSALINKLGKEHNSQSMEADKTVPPEANDSISASESSEWKAINSEHENLLDNFQNKSDLEMQQLSLFSDSVQPDKINESPAQDLRNAPTSASIKIHKSNSQMHDDPKEKFREPITSLLGASDAALLKTSDQEYAIKVSWDSNLSSEPYEVDPSSLMGSPKNDSKPPESAYTDQSESRSEITASELLSSLAEKSEKPEKTEEIINQNTQKSLSAIFGRHKTDTAKQETPIPDGISLPFIPSTEISPKSGFDFKEKVDLKKTENDQVKTDIKESEHPHNRSMQHTTVIKRSDISPGGFEDPYSVDQNNIDQKNNDDAYHKKQGFLEITRKRFRNNFGKSGKYNNQDTDVPIYSRIGSEQQTRMGPGIYGSFILAWLLPAITMVLLMFWSNRLTETPLLAVNKESLEYRLSKMIGLTRPLNIKLPDEGLLLTNIWAQLTPSKKYIKIGGWVINNSSREFRKLTIESALYDKKNHMIEKVRTELPNELQTKKSTEISEYDLLTLQKNKTDNTLKPGVGLSITVVTDLPENAHWYTARIYSAS
ncbi:MAG TPA: zinc-ribbon domain-containing protein [Oligoflexia bacterium]|nr:zinc-ribbon domain-containing protein [Oligoflexia bacterium]HMP48900.1 zinc-ribbon domain-containing protein [Oligoflexia bacterium]